jgi:hypothetical protein
VIPLEVKLEGRPPDIDVLIPTRGVGIKPSRGGFDFTLAMYDVERRLAWRAEFSAVLASPIDAMPRLGSLRHSPISVEDVAYLRELRDTIDDVLRSTP